jgi:hypothetical protein
MARNRLKLLGAGLGVLGMLTTMATVAGADNIVVNPTTTVAFTGFDQTASRDITLMAVDDPNWKGDNGPSPACNIRTSSGAQYVKVSVSSTNPAVATADVTELTFNDCGESHRIRIKAGSTVCNGTATINITVVDTKTAAPPRVSFTDASIGVTLNVPNCDTGGGGGGTTICAQPAAPAWAAAILQANSIKPGSKAPTNYISQVAKMMMKGAAFPDYRAPNPGLVLPVLKTDQSGYADAVYAFLKTIIDPNKLPNGPGAAARPGWVECTTTPPSA